MFGGFQVGPFQRAYQQVIGQQVSADAGRRRIGLRSIYRIKIDGRGFEFRSLADALTFLEKAKAKALELARQVAREATEKQREAATRVPVPKPPTLKIEGDSRLLRGAIAETKREIDAIYRAALIDAEIAMIFELDKRAEDDEETIFWLM